MLQMQEIARHHAREVDLLEIAGQRLVELYAYLRICPDEEADDVSEEIRQVGTLHFLLGLAPPKGQPRLPAAPTRVAEAAPAEPCSWA